MSSNSRQPSRMPLFLTDDDVDAMSDWDEAISAIRSAYSTSGDDRRTPGRIFAQTEREWMRIMPSVPAGGRLFGAKSMVGSFADGLHVGYLITLFDKDTAELAALVDGNRVTGLRTAATTAVGAAALTPSRAVTLGVVGSGFEARSHVAALSHVLDIAEVLVYSPTTANRERFAADVTTLVGVPARAVDTARDAAGCDVVLCAARSRDETPTVLADWVGPDSTVLSIGSTTPAQRELDTELIRRASIVVVDTVEEVVHGSGDMLHARADGVDVDSLVVPLSDVLCTQVEPDLHRGIRIYKSTGSGLQDVVVAEMLVDRARAEGRGTVLPVGIVTSRK
ncbi:ornithine cyclodeaminase family protein [Rhodococcoides trifolii]|nr:ornithine cyclodeaminase family protein [Rhodococcus trifolii]